jgi:hypothetical protein
MKGNRFSVITGTGKTLNNSAKENERRFGAMGDLWRKGRVRGVGQGSWEGDWLEVEEQGRRSYCSEGKERESRMIPEF